MVELISIAGVATTLPPILSGTWSVLSAAFVLYGNVDLRRTQTGLLLDRCRDLVVKIVQYLSLDPEMIISPSLQAGIDELQETCYAVEGILKKLKQKGFLWSILNQNVIDNQILDVKTRLTHTFEVFNFIAHIDRDGFQREMRLANEQDHTELVVKLHELSANDQRILDALQDHGGVQRRLEELLVAVQKCVEGLGSEQSPQAKFLRRADTALQRMSQGRPQSISEDWIVTSLEVDFDTTNAIGQGSFGRVYRGQWNAAVCVRYAVVLGYLIENPLPYFKCPKLVAIKQMYIDDARTLTERNRKMMRKEVKVWTTLHHPNILNLYGACLEAEMPFLVMQYCRFGNLGQYLLAKPNANRIDLSYDIVAGMTYLHSRGIIHADLKAVNILVDDNHNALVADFGLSQSIDSIRSQSGHSSRGGGARGTLRWMAPECLDGGPETKASDVYSLGLTIWEIFSDEVPFSNITDRLIPRHVVDRQLRPGRPSRLHSELLNSDAIWNLVQSCWVHEAVSRPLMSAVQRSFARYTSRLDSRTQGSVSQQTGPAALRSHRRLDGIDSHELVHDAPAYLSRNPSFVPTQDALFPATPGSTPNTHPTVASLSVRKEPPQQENSNRSSTADTSDVLGVMQLSDITLDAPASHPRHHLREPSFSRQSTRSEEERMSMMQSAPPPPPKDKSNFNAILKFLRRKTSEPDQSLGTSDPTGSFYTLPVGGVPGISKQISPSPNSPGSYPAPESSSPDLNKTASARQELSSPLRIQSEVSRLPPVKNKPDPQRSIWSRNNSHATSPKSQTKTAAYTDKSTPPTTPGRYSPIHAAHAVDQHPPHPSNPSGTSWQSQHAFQPLRPNSLAGAEHSLEDLDGSVSYDHVLDASYPSHHAHNPSSSDLNQIPPSGQETAMSILQPHSDEAPPKNRTKWSLFWRNNSHADDREREEQRKAEHEQREERERHWQFVDREREQTEERPGSREERYVDREKEAAELTRMIGYLTATASEDWALVLEVCERASSSEGNAKEAVRALRREFKYGPPSAQLSAARLWAIMLRNSSDVFITQCTSKKFLETLEDVLTDTGGGPFRSREGTSPVVRERVMDVLAAAAYASRSKKDSGFRGLWKKVKPLDKPDEASLHFGIPFDTDDAMFNPPVAGGPGSYYESNPPSAALYDPEGRSNTDFDTAQNGNGGEHKKDGDRGERHH